MIKSQNRKLRIIYWCDPSDTVEEEANRIQRRLYIHKIEFSKFETTIKPCLDKYFDILFFDWGGMSSGNSMLEHFCSNIIDHAQDHPNRLYVMFSLFTERAMEEALIEMRDKPANVFLTLEKALPFMSYGSN